MPALSGLFSQRMMIDTVAKHRPAGFPAGRQLPDAAQLLRSAMAPVGLYTAESTDFWKS